MVLISGGSPRGSIGPLPPTQVPPPHLDDPLEALVPLGRAVRRQRVGGDEDPVLVLDRQDWKRCGEVWGRCEGAEEPHARSDELPMQSPLPRCIRSSITPSHHMQSEVLTRGARDIRVFGMLPVSRRCSRAVPSCEEEEEGLRGLRGGVCMALLRGQHGNMGNPDRPHADTQLVGRRRCAGSTRTHAHARTW